MQAMNQLHPDVVAEVQSRALYSTEEESLMGTVSSVRLHTTCTCSSHMNERYTHVIPFKSQPILLSHGYILVQVPIKIHPVLRQ